MSPQEHYREAERLLDLVMADNQMRNSDGTNLAAAQVHATLAAAGATAQATPSAYVLREWAPTLRDTTSDQDHPDSDDTDKLSCPHATVVTTWGGERIDLTPQEPTP